MRPSAIPERKVKLCGACMSPIDTAPCGAAGRGWAGVGDAALGAGCACATGPGTAGACKCCAQAQLAKAMRIVAMSDDFSATMARGPFGTLVVFAGNRCKTSRHRATGLGVAWRRAAVRSIVERIERGRVGAIVAPGSVVG